MRMLSSLVVSLAVFAAGLAQAAVVVKDVTYKSGDTTHKGVLAYDDAAKGKRPGLIVVHEWLGITKHVRDYTKEMATKGYTVLAVDMFGEGKTASDPKAANALAEGVLGKPDLLKSRFEAGMKYLASQPNVDAARIGAIGFCFGGGVALAAARMGEPLAGVASFHGFLATDAPVKPGDVKGRILILHGGADPFVKPEEVAAFRKEMAAAKVDYKLFEYPGAKHAFTNPEATAKGKEFNLPLEYNAEATRKSKAEADKFFAEVFGKR